MPTYIYFCTVCGEQEINQKITENPLSNCPRCDTEQFRKVYTAAPAHFKGNGFYSTDKVK
jgi:putative FmdB family regulatory protein